MLKLLHRILLSSPLTRSAHRAALVRIKQALGYSDPFDDIARVIAATGPACLLDIGSHVGKTIARLSEFSGALPIHGFEPTPGSFEILQRRFRNAPHVHLHPFALGDRTGKAIIHCNRNEQTNSLRNNDRGNRESLSEATETLGELEINLQTLDQWYAESGIEGGLVIKCDVQGAEGMVLDGGREAFRSKVYAFYSEAQIAPMYEGQIAFDELHRRLTTEFDFSLANIYPCFRDRFGKALQTDALWIRNDKFRSDESD